MIVHEDPGVNSGLCLSGDAPPPGYKFFSALIVMYDLSPLDTPANDIMQDARGLPAMLRNARRVGARSC